MMKIRIQHAFAILLFVLVNSTAFSQSVKDTVEFKTPFRKGRWLTGLSGSISSGTSSLDTIGSGMTRNQYSIDFKTGKFLKDRILLGGLVMLSRSSSEEFTKRTKEILYVGPLVTWYFTEGDKGSLFIGGSGGFVNFRDESGFLQTKPS